MISSRSTEFETSSVLSDKIDDFENKKKDHLLAVLIKLQWLLSSIFLYFTTSKPYASLRAMTLCIINI